MIKTATLLAAYFVTVGFCGAAQAADSVRIQFLDSCLNSSKRKYDMFQNCIGTFSRVCAIDFTRYEDVLADISVGPPYRNCSERESIWWRDIFEEEAAKLIDLTAKNPPTDTALATLKTTLLAMESRALNECGYVRVRWGYREGGSVQIQGINDSFRCFRDIHAENAITVYLWNLEAD